MFSSSSSCAALEMSGFGRIGNLIKCVLLCEWRTAYGRFQSAMVPSIDYPDVWSRSGHSGNSTSRVPKTPLRASAWLMKASYPHRDCDKSSWLIRMQQKTMLKINLRIPAAAKRMKNTQDKRHWIEKLIAFSNIEAGTEHLSHSTIR